MNLKYLFNPSSIAVVGASAQVASIGNDLVKNLVQGGFKGKIFPVNPKLTELFGLNAFASLTAIPEPADLAVIAVPAPVVLQVIKEAAVKKIKAAVIITAGFKESGHADLEKDIAEICQKNKIALVGPNCLGVINPDIKMNASFATTMPESGPLAFITQSGALATAILDYAQKLNIGFSKLISLGNKALIDEADVLEYLVNDKNIKAVAIYAENLSNPQKLIAISKKITCGRYPKAIFILKSGRTSAGALASVSHTGAIAGSDEAYDALFRQSGIIRVRGNTELFEYARSFANNELHVGNRVAIVTNAGGPGVLAADEAESSGLKMAVLEPKTTAELKKFLPQFASVNNPVDMLGDAKADRYQNTLEAIINDKNVDSVLTILTPQSTTEIEKTAQIIIDIKNKTKKPIVANFIGGPAVSQSVRMMQKCRVATVNFPEQGARALGALSKFNSHCRIKNDKIISFPGVDKNKVRAILDKAKLEGRTLITEAKALEILEAYNFPTLKRMFACDFNEAKNIAEKSNHALAMKIVSEDITHKTEVGGVLLNINAENVVKNYRAMMRSVKSAAPMAKIEGVLLVEMVEKGGVEMILGSKKDPALGNIIMVGLGGIYVEIFKDVTFGISPITEFDATRMLEQLKSKKILDGARGQAPADTKSLIENMCRLSQLINDFPEIKELDINPLIVLADGKGSRVIDARIVI